MALRSMLRLVSPSGPVHGISPAAASRFMKTGSQVQAKTVAEQESIRLSNQHLVDAHNKYDKVFAQLQAARQIVGEFSKTGDDFRKIGNAAVVVAILPIMIIGKNYQE